jgi:hypothetical protein
MHRCNVYNKRKHLEYNVPAYLCLIDIKKAFDTVQIQNVIHLLYNKHISPDLIKSYRKHIWGVSKRTDRRLSSIPQRNIDLDFVPKTNL